MTPPAAEAREIEALVESLEARRGLLGDAVIDAAIAPLRARLAAAAPSPAGGGRTDPVLKQVSVLFVDVVGSTALSRDLDPEDIQAVIDGALARYAGVVEAHGGKVLQFAGDSLLAAFGADETREDDVERAVRAGLAVLDESRVQKPSLVGRYGLDRFDLRVGLHTGPVLLGGGVDDAATIRGITVNIAARMEQTAPPGRLRISHDAYRHVRGVFDVERQRPMAIKGIAEPVVTYLVLGAKPRAFRVVSRGIEGVETRMVGRQAELGRLQALLEGIRASGRLTVVTVVAEAGLGKSRLLHEFESWAEVERERFFVLRGRATPAMAGQTYALLRDVMTWRFGIADDDPMVVARQKIEDGVARLFAEDGGAAIAEAHAHLLGHLIGLDFGDSPHVGGIRDDPRQIRHRAFHAAAELVRRASIVNDCAVVFVLDDLHWADAGSLDFLDYLIEVDRDVPLLLLALTRPGLFEKRPGWGASADAHRIELQPLDRGDSDRLVDELLKKLDSVPSTLRELVIGGAEGNPFYMEEFVKMLVDVGAIDARADRWAVVPERLLSTEVPRTLVGVLQARLDGLDPAARRALQHAAVVGFVFWDGALAAIERSACDALPVLIRRQLVVPRDQTRLDGVREYAFGHQLLHQVTYETVLKESRRAAHARVAAWMTGLEGARSDDFVGHAAEHFDRAGDRVNAVACYLRAAQNAASRYGDENTVRFVDRALALLPETDDDAAAGLRWRLVALRERIFDLHGRRVEQRRDIDTLDTLAERLDDDAHRGEAAWRRSDFAMRTSDYRTAVDAGRAAMAYGARTGSVELRLRAQQRVASGLTHLEHADEAYALAMDGLAAARAARLPKMESMFLNALSVVAGSRDDMAASLEAARMKLAIDRSVGDRRNEAVNLANIGTGLAGVGELASARSHLEDSLAMARSVGDRAVVSFALVHLSLIARREGRPAEALDHARRALEQARAVNARVYEAVALLRIGDAELDLCDHPASTAAFEAALALSKSIDYGTRYDAAAGIARIALAQGNESDAAAALGEVFEHLANGGRFEAAELPSLIRLTCYRVLSATADPRAMEVLDDGARLVREKAARITDDALRDSFLTAIVEHRELLEAAERAGRFPRG